MERLESFVAGSLLQRLERAAAVDGDRSAAAAASLTGAVLFVDISNYTPFAEALCNQGPHGIEQLGKILDGAFGAYVHAVDETGGEIACFAGDAFIAYWVVEDGSVPRALQHALECAAHLHAVSLNVPSSATRSAPKLHVGVSAGNMWAARLGSDQQWQMLLAGPAVEQACAESARAAAGETVIASAAHSFNVSAPDELLSGAGALVAAHSASLSAPVDVIPHVPKRVQQYVGEGYSAWIPQRRTICALFVRIDRVDSASDVLARHQSVVTSLQVALRPYTGSTGTLLRDDKGLVFTLCLGMPHDAHADDALRAVRAGLAVRSELSRLGLGCAIGVASGPGVCMPLGGPERRHYWSVGRFMHLAGRLMEAAGSGMLCTEEIADQVRRAVSLSPERPLRLKGLQWPVHVFRVHDAPSIAEQADALYGRENEQAVLNRSLDALESGRGSVVWMVADAGLGKTALVHFLRQAASQRNVLYLSGAAASVEIAIGYVAWRPVFDALLPAASRHLGTIQHPQLAPLINAVVPGFLEETPVVKALVGQARADATLSLLSEVIGAHTSGRFLLVLEDCHWMDSASWRLVLRVAQDHPQALIVLTSRPTADVQEMRGLRLLDRFTEMKLLPLRSDAIAALVQHVLGPSASQELIDEITERSVGNPLFAREYALLLSTRMLPREFGSPKPAAPAQRSEPVPVTVQTLIASRLDALSPSADLALKAASVVGDRFTVDLLARVYPGNPQGEALDAILARLVERQLIVPAEGAAGAFDFQHALIREVTYEQLTSEQRRDLHRRVAETIARDYESDLRPHFAALAHHWSRAEVPGFTIRYADQAAGQALTAGAFEEADRLLNTCIQLAKQHEVDVHVADKIRWHRQLADARQGLGLLESRTAAARQVLRLAGVSQSHTPVGHIIRALGRMCRLRMWRALPAAWRTAPKPEAIEVARAFRHSAEVRYFNNDMLGMICDDISAVSLASMFGPSRDLVTASTELAGILSVAGLRRSGKRMLQRAIAMAEAADDRPAQAHAQLVSCLYNVGIGDWQAAETSARRCQALCEPIDDRVNWTNAQAVRFWMSHYRCHEAAAFDAARSLRDRASETGNRQHRAWGFRFLALCALRRGEPREAVPLLQAGLDTLGQTVALNERLPTLGILAAAQLQAGDVWAARATARDALGQIARARRPIGHSTLEGYSALVTVALDAWRDEPSPEWERAIKTSLRGLARYRKSFPVGVPRYELHLGEYRRARGARRAARRSYRRGEWAAARLGMPWEAKHCRQALQEISRG